VSDVLPPAAAHARRSVDQWVGWTSPLVGVLLGLGLATSRWAPPIVAALLVVVAAQLLVASGWHLGVRAEQPTVGALAGLGLGLVADVLVLAQDAVTLEVPIAVLGVGFLVVVLQQLARRDDRKGVLVSMATTVSLAALTTLGAAWLVVAQVQRGEVPLWVAGLALAAASAGRWVASDAWAPWAAVVAGVVAGWLSVVLLAGDGSTGVATGVAIGVGCGVAVGVCDAFVRGATTVFRLRWLMPGAVPALVAAPLVYLALRLTA
jgi:hypothetical protein